MSSASSAGVTAPPIQGTDAGLEATAVIRSGLPVLESRCTAPRGRPRAIRRQRPSPLADQGDFTGNLVATRLEPGAVSLVALGDSTGQAGQGIQAAPHALPHV